MLILQQIRGRAGVRIQAALPLDFADSALISKTSLRALADING